MVRLIALCLVAAMAWDKARATEGHHDAETPTENKDSEELLEAEQTFRRLLNQEFENCKNYTNRPKDRSKILENLRTLADSQRTEEEEYLVARAYLLGLVGKCGASPMSIDKSIGLLEQALKKNPRNPKTLALLAQHIHTLKLRARPPDTEESLVAAFARSLIDLQASGLIKKYGAYFREYMNQAPTSREPERSLRLKISEFVQVYKIP